MGSTPKVHLDAAKSRGIIVTNPPDVLSDATAGIALPHIGSATRETRDAMGFRALDNLDAIFAGREPGDRVA